MGRTSKPALVLALLSTIGCTFNKAGGAFYAGPVDVAQGSSQLVVYRPIQDGFDRTYTLRVDDEDRAEMQLGGFSRLTVEPGSHDLRTEIDFTIRAWLPGIILIILPFIIYSEMNPPGEVGLSVDLASGEIAYVRFDPLSQTLEQVGATQAQNELAECRSQDGD